MDHPVVVITGASAGIGRAAVRAYAKRGAKIALLARGHQGLEATRKEVLEAGAEALSIPTDVSDPAAVELAAERTERELGPIDIWINNAMITAYSEFLDLTPLEFQRITQVTYLGYVYGTMAALKRMLPRNKGTIVQVGSVLAYRGLPLQSAYCGAKHAIKGFTESVRVELMHRNADIWLTMVHLPAVNTPQFTWGKNKMPRKSQPVPPIFQPEVAADAIVWAAAHRRREVVVGGNSLLALWANKFFPGVIDWYLSKTAYSSQQHDGHNDPNAPDNLFAPVEGNYGARGDFGDRSQSHSRQLSVVKMPGYPLYGGIAVVALTSLLIARAISGRKPCRCACHGAKITLKH